MNVPRPLGALHRNARVWVVCWLLWRAALVAAHASDGVDHTTSRVIDTICLARSPADVLAEYIRYPVCSETRWVDAQGSSPDESVPRTSGVNGSASIISPPSATAAVLVDSDHELDTDSPLDNANFLSFEDWKRQNLA